MSRLSASDSWRRPARGSGAHGLLRTVSVATGALGRSASRASRTSTDHDTFAIASDSSDSPASSVRGDLKRLGLGPDRKRSHGARWRPAS
jgi:hypothetical protein